MTAGITQSAVLQKAKLKTVLGRIDKLLQIHPDDEKKWSMEGWFHDIDPCLSVVCLLSVCVSVYVRLCLYVCLNVCLCLYVCLSVSVSMYPCLHVCMYVCVIVCVCVFDVLYNYP